MNCKITIDVVTGGFVMTYPLAVATGQPERVEFQLVTEVFTSQRKLNQKIKDVIAAIGLVSE